MIDRIQPNYRKPFIAAIILHLILLMLLIGNWVFVKPQLPSAVKSNQVVKATVLDEGKIQQEIIKLKHERTRKHRQKVAEAKRLKAEALTLKKQRLAEQRRIQTLKNEAKKQKALAAKKLAELKKQKNMEAKKLDKLKAAQRAEMKKQEEVEKQAALLAKRRNAEKAEQERQALALKVQNAVSTYKPLILQKITQHWLISQAYLHKKLSCQLQINLSPGGNVQNVKITRSSGDPALDRSARAAVYKASPLPVPTDAKVFDKFRLLSLTVRPEKFIS